MVFNITDYHRISAKNLNLTELDYSAIGARVTSSPQRAGWYKKLDISGLTKVAHLARKCGKYWTICCELRQTSGHVEIQACRGCATKKAQKHSGSARPQSQSAGRA